VKLCPKITLEGTRMTLKTEIAFATARAKRIGISGKPEQYDDLGLLIEEQAQFRELAERSNLQHLEVDVSSGNVAAAADEIADWLERTGGLGSPE